ncbi:DUF3667 domain-containing protein [Spongiimicrobium salis]|uniref:DUF3667 domain-containing protein n=1 Tax=Spongiimicrobium salis TaxID=1667022 RepID=UPI00374DEBFA
MTCKNCTAALSAENNFCASCGAKIIKDRITVKNLIADLLNAIGWDNKYFKTIKALILQPGQLFREYLGGARKKYMTPFSFLGIGVTIALFIFNIFSEQFIAITTESSSQTNEFMINFMKEKFGDAVDTDQMRADAEATSQQYALLYLKYFNVFVILLMPLYAFMSSLVYRKSHSYGEHFVINCYILGLSFLATSIFFVISLFTAPYFYYITILLLIFYYTYAYGRLYQFSVKQSVIKLLKFVGILILFIPVFLILMVILGILVAIIIAVLKRF